MNDDFYDYYIFITPDNTIWGVGTSKKETILDAIKNLSGYYKTDELPPKGKVLNSSSELAWAIWDNGYTEGMWEFDNKNNWAVLAIPAKDHYSKVLNVKETKLRYD